MSVLEPYQLTEISYGLIRWDLLYNSNLAIIRNELAKSSDVVITAGESLAKDNAFAIHGTYAYKAQATNSNTVYPARGMVLSSTIGSGGTGYGKLFGVHTVTTTLTTIGTHYLSPSTPGMITPVKPIDYIQPMAEAMSLISIIVDPMLGHLNRAVDPTNTSTIYEKVVSNNLAKGWEDHKALTYSNTPHGIVAADLTSSDTVRNRMVANRDLYAMGKAMIGDMILTITPNSLGTIAATLNAAGVGTYVQTLTIALKTTTAVVHNWFVNTIGLESTEAISDSDVTFPTLSNTINVCVAGQAIVTATYDTDAGSTKTYAANDYVSIMINTITLMGYILPAVTLVDSIQ